MTYTTILLSNSETTQRALRKVLGNLFGNAHFVVPDLPMVPPEIDLNEFLVSEAMKLACNNNKRVIILDVDKKNIIEKTISCKRFHSLVGFIPSAKILTNLFQSSDAWKDSVTIPCEMTCTVFERRCNPRNSNGNLYSGSLIFKICHTLSHRNIGEISLVMPLIRLIRSNRLFVPLHGDEKDLVDSFLKEIERLYQTESKDEFKRESLMLLKNLLYKDFPYFTGDI
jgi:hypothetical protein